MGKVTKPKLSDVLQRLGACPEAIAWVKANANGATTARQRWEECPRGDWMIWTLRAARVVDDRAYRLVACDIATAALEDVRKRGREPDPRSWRAIKVARAYANGQSDAEALRKARYAANAAYYAADAADAAAASAASNAAYYASAAAAAAAAAAAVAAAYARSADIVRRHFPADAVERALYTLWTST